MVTRVKQQNVIYSSLAESMLDGEIKIDDNSWSLTNNFISISSHHNNNCKRHTDLLVIL